MATVIDADETGVADTTVVVVAYEAQAVVFMSEMGMSGPAGTPGAGGLNESVVHYVDGAYLSRPEVTHAVIYLGPVQPTTMLPIDLWLQSPTPV